MGRFVSVCTRLLLRQASRRLNQEKSLALQNCPVQFTVRTLSTSSYLRNYLHFTDSEGFDRRLNTIWLRENCHCNECYTHSTNQRHVLFHKLNTDFEPTEHQVNGDELNIIWSDGHKSNYSVNWLKNNIHEDDTPDHRPAPKVERTLWDKEHITTNAVEPVPAGEFLREDLNNEAMTTFLRNLYKYGFAMVNKVNHDEASTKKVVERLSFIQETFFGRTWTFTADLARGDTAYTNIALGAHTDSTYLETPTGIQVFHCLYHDGEGGETLLVDGFRCCEDLRRKHPEEFDLLSSVRIEHEYREPGVHVRSLDSIIKAHPVTGALHQFRYNPYDRSPIKTIAQENVGCYYKALDMLAQQVENPQNEFWLKLKPGTVLFIDNWRVMHGRASFTGKRVMTGCYLPRDEWLSKARTLGVI